MSTAELIGYLIFGAVVLGAALIWSGFHALGTGLMAMSSSSTLVIHYLSIEMIDFYGSKGLEAEATALQDSVSQSSFIVTIAWIFFGLSVLGLVAKDVFTE